MENQDFKYSGKINYLKAQEWGLSANLCILFDWMYGVPAWAEHVIVNDEIFFFASKNKAISDLVILTDKIDTMYRYYKQLEDKGLIIIKKIGDRDYIRLTEKGKKWDRFERGLVVGNKSEHSEINPSEVGNKSEKRSEINPTYNSIIHDNSISNKDIYTHASKDKSFPLKDQKEKEKKVASKKVKRWNKSDFRKFFIENGADPQILEDWLDVRSKKRSPFTYTVAKSFMQEIKTGDININDALRMCAVRGWVGFKSEWYENANNRGKQDDAPTFHMNRPQD